MESSSAYQNLQNTASGLTLAINAREQRRIGHGKLCATCVEYYGPKCDMRLEETHGKPIQCSKYKPEQ